jgi:hypothetical protein
MSKHQHGEHSHHDGACGCILNPQSAAVAQNLDEMAFERGLWGGALYETDLCGCLGAIQTCADNIFRFSPFLLM